MGVSKAPSFDYLIAVGGRLDERTAVASLLRSAAERGGGVLEDHITVVGDRK
jgi:hypothetical protein